MTMSIYNYKTGEQIARTVEIDTAEYSFQLVSLVDERQQLSNAS